MLIIYFFIFLNFFWILLSIAVSANVIATNIIVTNFIITCNIANSLADNIMLRLFEKFSLKFLTKNLKVLTILIKDIFLLDICSLQFYFRFFQLKAF